MKRREGGRVSGVIPIARFSGWAHLKVLSGRVSEVTPGPIAKFSGAVGHILIIVN